MLELSASGWQLVVQLRAVDKVRDHWHCLDIRGYRAWGLGFGVQGTGFTMSRVKWLIGHCHPLSFRELAHALSPIHNDTFALQELRHWKTYRADVTWFNLFQVMKEVFLPYTCLKNPTLFDLKITRVRTWVICENRFEIENYNRSIDLSKSNCYPLGVKKPVWQRLIKVGNILDTVLRTVSDWRICLLKISLIKNNTFGKEKVYLGSWSREWLRICEGIGTGLNGKWMNVLLRLNWTF